MAPHFGKERGDCGKGFRNPRNYSVSDTHHPVFELIEVVLVRIILVENFVVLFLIVNPFEFMGGPPRAMFF